MEHLLNRRKPHPHSLRLKQLPDEVFNTVVPRRSPNNGASSQRNNAKECVDFTHERLKYPIRIEQRNEFVDSKDNEFIWDIAIALSKYLCDKPEIVKNKTVVELGAGVGLCGLVAGALGAETVYLTDLPRGVPLLHYNAAINGLQGNVRAQQLCWGCEDDVQSCIRSMSEQDFTEVEIPDDKVPKKDVDVVLCCDLLFNHEENIERLLWTVQRLLSENTTVLVAYEFRDNALNDLRFFEEMQDLCDVFAIDAAKYFDGKTLEYYTKEGMLDNFVIYQYTPYASTKPEFKDSIPVKTPTPFPGPPLAYPLPNVNQYTPRSDVIPPFQSLATKMNPQGVLPYTLSIGMMGGGAATILEYGSPLPTSRSRCFQVCRSSENSDQNAQDDISLALFLGDAVMARDNVFIGSIDFPKAVLPNDGLIIIKADVNADTNDLEIVVSTPKNRVDAVNSDNSNQASSSGGRILAYFDMPGDTWPEVKPARSATCSEDRYEWSMILEGVNGMQVWKERVVSERINLAASSDNN